MEKKYLKYKSKYLKLKNQSQIDQSDKTGGAIINGRDYVLYTEIHHNKYLIDYIAYVASEPNAEETVLAIPTLENKGITIKFKRRAVNPYLTRELKQLPPTFNMSLENIYKFNIYSKEESAIISLSYNWYANGGSIELQESFVNPLIEILKRIINKDKPKIDGI